MADAWGRSLHGERGLKFPIRECFSSVPGRSLHGERGLKSLYIYDYTTMCIVAPFTGSVD